MSLGPLIAMVIFLSITPAQAAAGLSKQGFFDWDYVVRVWTTFDNAQADEAYDRLTPHWERWVAENGARLYPESLEALNEHPDADQIKRGHDLAKLGQIWSSIYQKWRLMNYTIHGMKPWNKNIGWECDSIQHRNIFTRKCNDIPDWRGDESRARDNAAFARNPHKNFR